ncbi:MAG: hypothetical protein OXH07_06675 [Chloroflexi bacterium]|nr:hypothetical protein [Chloroflexota bacterium]
MPNDALSGQVIATIGGGDAHHRAVAVAVAEAGASVALATFNAIPDQEFSVNSVANEVWALGRDHFADVIEASDPEQMGAFTQKTWSQLGRCDAIIVVSSLPTPSPDSPVEEKRAFAGRHRTPLLAAQAFGQLMREKGGGAVVFVAPERDPADDKALNAALSAHLGAGGPRITVVGRNAPAPDEAAAGVLAVLSPEAAS